MNILFVGHDLSYARFYAATEAALRARTEVSARHLYIRPSAYLYAKLVLGLRAHSPSLLRLLGRWRRDPQHDTGPIDLRFYAVDGEPRDRGRFESLHAAYCAYLRPILGREAFDVAVLPGEYRLFEQAVIAVLAEARRPPLSLYFEVGPPGYVYLDRDGANANASFAMTGVNRLLAEAGPPPAEEPAARTDALSGPLRLALHALDVAWLVLAKSTRGLLDLQEYWVAARNRLQRRKAAARPDDPPPAEAPPGRCLIFVGQVHNDINHTHFGLTDAELEQRLAALLRGEPALRLAWRDHPMERSDELFARLAAAFPGRVQRPPAMPLKRALTDAEGVVTVNSNGGLEALAAGLPVLLLGRSYFAGLAGVCRDDASFRARREAIREHGPDPAIRADAERFLRECFLPIDYRGEDFRRAHLAANVILSAQHEQ